MSLYMLQKVIYELNRDTALAKAYLEDREAVMQRYELSAEEAEALRKDDVGKLYVLGVNGQILMHYAAWRGFAWDDYLEAMREGLKQHGPVRAGPSAAAREGAAR
jgi:hypothetical protein